MNVFLWGLKNINNVFFDYNGNDFIKHLFFFFAIARTLRNVIQNSIYSYILVLTFSGLCFNISFYNQLKTLKNAFFFFM